MSSTSSVSSPGTRSKIKFRASENVALLSAMEALNSLHETQKDKPEQPKKPAKKKRKRKGKNDETAVDFNYDWPLCVCGMNHPPIPFFRPPDGKKCTYYWQIADMFPFMTLHRVLTTEIKFIAADKDQSGVIEKNELQALLQDIMGEDLKEYMVIKTFRQIDTDNSGSLDFSEVLMVVDGIIQRRTVELPNAVKNELSKTCTVQ